MRTGFFLVLFLMACFIGKAQNTSSESDTYKIALGVKIWDGAGISYKQFLNEKNAAEVIGYFYYKGFRLTGLYQYYGGIPAAEGLRWYAGAGAHMGFYNALNGKGRSTVFGADGVAGLDYKFNGSPIDLSIDWQPGFEFASGFGLNSWGGIGIRYILK